MTQDLKQEIQQKKPFRSLYQEAQLNIVRTSNLLADAFEQMLKPHGITGTQFNVLRILRGAEPEGLCRNEVRERLINRMPDATRLLDRMEKSGLVSRARSGEDRRLVTTRITQKGRHLVDSLDDVVDKKHRQQLRDLSEAQLKSLIKILTQIRNTS